MNHADISKMDSSSLVEALIQVAGERALLTYSDAPDEELKSCQREMDTIQQELQRRICW